MTRNVYKDRESYFLKKIENQIINGRVDEAANTLKRIEIAATKNPEIQKLNLKSQKNFIVNEMKQINTHNSSVGNSLNVLYGTMEIAGQLNLYSKAIQKLGANSRVLSYYPNYLSYNSDYIYDLPSNEDHILLNTDTKEITRQALETFDVFHFMFNTTLMQDYSDLPLIKAAGKKIFMHNVGSDVRQYSISRKLTPYADYIVKNKNEDQIRKQIECLAQYIDHCIVADAELYEYVKSFYKQVHFIRQPIDLDKYKPLDNFVFRKEKPVIVHAPTSPKVKGTEHILNAINELKKDYNFEFIPVIGMSHEEAKKVYQQADIIVDQILIGGHGGFALEAMAMQKPVICFISNFMREYYPKDLPIVSANPKNIRQELKTLIEDYEYRKEIAYKGRSYVERYHDVNIIAKQLFDLYQNY